MSSSDAKRRGERAPLSTRDKLGMVGFGVLLLAVWAGGFAWFSGAFEPSDKDQVTNLSSPAKARLAPTPSAPGQPAADSADEPQVGPTALATTLPAPLPGTQVGDARPDAPRPKPQELPPVAEFRMATFNVLGSSHTSAGGKDARMASGPARVGGVLELLSRHELDVVGFQEFQGNQRAAFRSRVGDRWGMYPGDELRAGDGENSVAWRTDVWEAVEKKTVPIPYFNGRARNMPYVLLQHKATGIRAWFSTFHNPADTRKFRGQGGHRAAATSREIALFNELRQTGVPVFVTGDMNDRDSWFCRVTGSTGLIAAAGGSNGSGGCRPPEPTQIDWILGSPEVGFDGYQIVKDGLVKRTTDHPLVLSAVRIDALDFPKAFEPTS